MYKDNLGRCFLLISTLLFVSDNEALVWRDPDNRKALFKMTDGTRLCDDHKRPRCTTCAPVLGFRQPVAALTHVAIGPVSEGRNSINKTRPSTRCTVLQQRPSAPFSAPVTCQSVPLMSDRLGYHSYSLNRLLRLYVMKP